MNKFLSTLIAIAFSFASMQVMAADAPKADAAAPAAAHADGKCGGDKKAAKKAKKAKHADGKCGGDKKAADGKCGGDKKAADGKCGGDKKAPAK